MGTFLPGLNLVWGHKMELRDRIRNDIYDEADMVSKDWFIRQCRNIYSAMYLYFKPKHLKFYIGEEAPDEEWEIASLERIKISNTVEQTRHIVIEAVQNLPILPVDY